MTTRLTDAKITFEHTFTLMAFDEPQPAGTYRILMDDEAIDGLTFLATRRVATILETPAVGSKTASMRHTTVDQNELADALARDARESEVQSTVQRQN